MNFLNLSWSRFCAVVAKEFTQLRRDRLTFAMIVAIPLMQLVLFGYAINTNPKNLPTVVLSADHSAFTRAFVQGLKNTHYFNVDNTVSSEKKASKLLATTRAQFVISIPQNFTRKLVKGERPQILVEADATDPVATGSAISAVRTMTETVFNPLLIGNLAKLRATPGPVELVTQAKYNPESITEYNIVPGLLGVILTMTMAVITSMCITRERERGTMENLLATPVRPLEVMLGKLIPYIIIGYLQVFLILFMAYFAFHIPILGSIWLLLFVCLPFICANLAIGMAFSSMSENQLQATQMSIFYFLPSILLSGFMFPFRGMPVWAQHVGEILPLTYFLRIVRGIILKGNGFALIWIDLWPIILFMVIALFIGTTRYRRTLD